MEKNKNVPQLRFAGFTDDWEQRKLGDIVERVTRKNTNLESNLPLTISAQYGLISQTEFFDKQVASRDTSGYYLIENGEFAYNKSYSTGYPWGAIKRLDRYKKGVLSTLYICFKPIKVNSQFLVSYYDSQHWHNQMENIAVEGARNHGLLNIPTEDFFNTTLYIPKSTKEQTAIGNFFKQLDETIALHQRECEKYQNLKKSYLDKMFPKENELFPELRFPEFNDAWEQRKLGEIFDQTFNFTNPEKDNFELYSLTVEDGLTPKTDRYKRDFLVIKQDQFKLVEPYGFVYNPMNITLGAIDYNKLSNSVAVSGYYTTMSVKYGFDHNFLNIFLSSNTAIEIYRSQATGTLKEKQRVQFPTFSTLRIFVPSFEEQTAIGNFFKQLDETIALHQRELGKYKQIKQSYLEKMFV